MKQIIKKQYLILILFATNIVNSQTTPLNPVFEYFNVGQSFTSIAVEKDSLKLGQVWAGTAKKGLFNKSSASGTSFNLFTVPNLDRYTVQTLATDYSGNLWVGHNGLGLGSASGGGIELISKLEAPKHLYARRDNCYFKGSQVIVNDGYASRNIKSITVDKKGTVWVAQGYCDVYVSGIDPVFDPSQYIITPGTLSFKKAGSSVFLSKSQYSDIKNPNPDLPYPAYTCNPPIDKTAGTRTCSAVSSDKSSVWMSVYPYNADNGEYLPARLVVYDLNGVSTDGFTISQALFPDGSGVINAICANDNLGTWVTSSIANKGFSVRKGTQWYHIDATNFPNIIPAGARFNNNALWKNEYGNVFMGTDKGLIVYDGRGAVNDEKSYTLYNQARHGLISDNILGGDSELIVNYSPEELDFKLCQWIATDNGIIKANIGAIPTYVKDLNENAKRVEAEMDRRKAIPGGDKSYHEYTIVTEICDKTKVYDANNACIPCTQELVYKTMKQHSEFQIASPLVMTQDAIPTPFIMTLTDQGFKDIEATVNEQTKHIEYASDIFRSSSLYVQLAYNAFINGPYLHLTNTGEQIVLGIANQNSLNKDALNKLQNEFNGTGMTGNKIECKNDKIYHLYNSPAFIRGRGIFKANSKYKSNCDYELESTLYDPITMFVYDKTYTIVNYTLQGHGLDPGKVQRVIVEIDNKIYVVTLGVGYNFCSQSQLGNLSKRVNLSEGCMIFKNADIELKKFFNKPIK
jgi:hypothetical protein